MNEENYRPSNIEFEVINNLNDTPENLGKFQNAKEAQDFMYSNFAYLTAQLTAVRFMDNFEKSEIRKEYQEINEYELPKLQKELDEAINNERKAKEAAKNAKEAVNSKINTMLAMGLDVKRGTKTITLDEQFTYKIAFNGNYHYYTFIDNQIKLAKVCEIPESEKCEMYNNVAKNREFFDEWRNSITDPVFEEIYEQEKEILVKKGSIIDELLTEKSAVIEKENGNEKYTE